MSTGETHDVPRLGSCCGCGRMDGVTNIVMLPRRGAIPGRGWGCLVCGLPPEGVIAVFCNDCVGQEPRIVCRGYPASDGRMFVDELPVGTFDHDKAAHAGEGEPA